MRHDQSNEWNRCACCPEPRQPAGLEPVRRLSAPKAADELRAALARMGIPGDVHEGRGLALVSVWTGLVVWTDGLWYRWWTGRRSQTGRWLYAHHSAFEPERAARRLAARYAELREAPSIVAAGVS